MSVHICIILWKRIFIPIVILRIDIVANIYLNITMFLSTHPETFITSISCFPKLTSYIISNYLSIVMLVAVYAASLFKQMTSSNNKWLLIFLVMFHYNQEVNLLSHISEADQWLKYTCWKFFLVAEFRFFIVLQMFVFSFPSSLNLIN